MNRKVFVHLRTLIYVTLVSMLSISLTACGPEIPENKETITIGQYGSKVYCGASALDFSEVEGLKAYVATGYDNGRVTLTRVMTVKAGEGILIKGNAGNYGVPVIERSNDNTLNLFVGVQGSSTVYPKSEDGLYTNYYWDPAYTRFEPIVGNMDLENSAYIQVPAEWKSWSGDVEFVGGEFVNTENGR